MNKKLGILAAVGFMALTGCSEKFLVMPRGGAAQDLAGEEAQDEARNMLANCVENTLSSLDGALQVELFLNHISGSYSEYSYDNGRCYSEWNSGTSSYDYYYMTEEDNFNLTIDDFNAKIAVGVDGLFGPANEITAYASISNVSGKVSFENSTTYEYESEKAKELFANWGYGENESESWTVETKGAKLAAYLEDGTAYADISNEAARTLATDVCTVIDPDMAGVVSGALNALYNETKGLIKLDVSDLLPEEALVEEIDPEFGEEIIAMIEEFDVSEIADYFTNLATFVNFRKYNNGSYALEVDVTKDTIEDILEAIAIATNPGDEEAIEAMAAGMIEEFELLFPGQTDLHFVLKTDEQCRIRTIAVKADVEFVESYEDKDNYNNKEFIEKYETSIKASGEIDLRLTYGSMAKFPSFSKYQESAILSGLLSGGLF